MAKPPPSRLHSIRPDRVNAPIPVQIGGPKSGKGLTSDQLLRSTAANFPSRIKNRLDYNVTVVRANLSKSEPNKFALVTTEGKHGYTESKFHQQMVLRLEPLKKFTKSRLALSCSCSDYCFTFEYALYLRGAALEPHRSMLEPAVIKNPYHHVGCCKHLLSCLAWFRNRNL